MPTMSEVRQFDWQKGFGFIQPDDGSEDVFLHISTVELAEISGLREGQKVTFDIVGEGDKANAVNLRTL